MKRMLAAILSLIMIMTVLPYGSFEAEAASTNLPNGTKLIRMGGTDRFETANAIADEGWEYSEAAVVVSADAYADALAGGPLAVSLGAPIFLVRGDTVKNTVLERLSKLGVEEIYILGGQSAVSRKIEDQLAGLGYKITRIAGSTRYQTAVKIAEMLDKVNGGSSCEVFITSGVNYPDALSAGSIAAVKGAPILYSPKNGELDIDTTTYLSGLDIDKAYVLGGVNAVSQSVESRLRNLGASGIQRIGGANRYETSLLISKNFDDVFESSNVSFATGNNFPDALAGGAFAARQGIPVLLTDNKNVDAGLKTYIEAKKPRAVYVFGDVTVVSDNIIKGYLGLSAGGNTGNGGSVNYAPWSESELGAYTKNLKWNLDSAGTLTISGTGRMTDWDHNKGNYAPWYSKKDKIKKVVIKDGFTSIGNSAFFDCTILAGVTVPSSVKSIGNNAFTYCAIKTLSAPDGLRNIGEWALAYCPQLESFNVPKTVVNIGNYAFCNSKRLKAIVIPDGVSKIGHETFYECSTLSTVSIGSGVKEIGGWAFAYCPALESVDIPDSVTKIGERAFYYCTKLKEIFLPGKLESAGEYSLAGCEELKKIVIGKGTPQYAGSYVIDDYKGISGDIYIGSEARQLAGDLFGDVDLTTITVPNGITHIGGQVFKQSDLTSIVLPDSLTSIGNEAFRDCDRLASIDIPDGVVSIGDQAFSQCDLTSLVLPDSVVSIGSLAFNNCKAMVSVDLSDSLISIGDAAFAGNEFSSIVLPESLESIGADAFRECNKLKSINIPAKVKSIGVGAFASNADDFKVTVSGGNPYFVINGGVLFTKDMKTLLFAERTLSGEYSVPQSVTTIRDSAFLECRNLTSVTIPDGVRSIGADCFRDCTSLASVSLSSGLSSIEASTFKDCKSLAEIEIPYGVSVIGKYAFSQCSNLSAVVLPESLTKIEYSAFDRCENLKNIDIPDSVKEIGDDAFTGSGLVSLEIPAGVPKIAYGLCSGCRSLKRVTLHEGLKVISNQAFLGCSELSVINIPKTVTSIGNEVFLSCPSLTSVTIPDGVKSIGKSAFRYCSGLESVSLPNALTSIDSRAFEGCNSLRELTVPGSVTAIGEKAFSLCENLTIYAPHDASYYNYVVTGDEKWVRA